MASSSKAALIAAVLADVERGIFSTPLNGKRPFLHKWSSQKVTDLATLCSNGSKEKGTYREKTAEAWYHDPYATGRGIVLGLISGGLVDDDLDSPEAQTHAARYLLPARNLGHDGKTTHYLYRRRDRDTPFPRLPAFIDPLEPLPPGKTKAKPLIEILGDGEQVMAQPSIHPDTGSEITWSGADEFPEIDSADNVARVAALAADVLLGRYWPPCADIDCKFASLAYAGMLLDLGWSVDAVKEHLARAAVTVGCDQDADEMARRVDSTVQRRADKRDYTGGPTLASLLRFDRRKTIDVAEGVDKGAVIVAEVKKYLKIAAPAHSAGDEGRPAPDTDRGSIENVLAYEAQPPVGIDPAAYYGIAGIYVTEILPFTEASPIAELVTFLTAMGVLLGDKVCTEVGLQKQYANLFCVLEGETSLGRKGTANDDCERTILFPLLGQEDINKLILRGVGSGDGLIYQVRDASARLDAEGHPVDPGVADKRKLVVESEFSKVLKDCGFGAAGLASTICQAFDHKTLQRNYSERVIKKTPLCATNPHIGILASIQPDLLRKYLAVEEAASGFGNRFPIFHVERSQLLPKLPPMPPGLFKPIRAYLRAALAWAAAVKAPINLDREAEALWDTWYRGRAVAGKGLASSLASRAPSHVRRFALVHAALDCSPCIRRVHLEAALALWDYAERSLVYIYGDQTGDKDAQDILNGIRESKSKNREQIFKMFQGHFNAGRLNAALSRLIKDGQITHSKGPTTERGGRPPDIYTPTPAARPEAKIYDALKPDLEQLETYDLVLEHLLRDDPPPSNEGVIRSKVKLGGPAPKPRPVPRHLRRHLDYWKALCALDAPAEF